jgi:acyl-homoserine-lactone acylase
MLTRPGLSTFAALCSTFLAACAHAPPAAPPLPELATQVEIRRTTYGVPQIHAENLSAAAFALAYAQLEDYGAGIIRGMQAARGRLALVEGSERVDMDARGRQRHARALETFGLLHDDTRDVYVGFAEGMNHFIRVRRAELPDWVRPDFTAIDILARDISMPGDAAINAFRRRLLANPDDVALLALDETGSWRRVGTSAADTGGDETERSPAQSDDATSGGPDDSDVILDDALDIGSNAWALAPERTTGGRAILLRNPHLAWTAGYYEAHLRVPGKLDFYGDFRIGGPFTVIGGFNAQLGFATTNNASRSHEFYAVRADPSRPDHILLDDASVPLERELVSVEYRDSAGIGVATREFWSSHLGPVVHRTDSLVYIYRPATLGEFRAGEQWLEMMKAASFDEWRDAMRIQARTTSNFTYADAAGNIFYVWVTTAPLLPHPAGGDTLAILATRAAHVWSRIAPFDALPHLLNPPGGYVRNENDSPHYTNLHRVLPDSFGFWVEPPRLRLRSQHGLELLHNDRVFSLEDVVATKHSMRMLLADRVKDDLIAAVTAATPEGEVARASALLAEWDNTVVAGSRGGVLFETWWNRYRSLVGDNDVHAVDWSAAAPTTTPRGLADPERAVEAFAWAVPETARRWGAWDVTWGVVHRVRRGDVDAPVGGCGGALGCFRVLNFVTDTDGRRVVSGGDGWVIAIEFGDPPRAYSVLGYGQSPDPASPHHADQAELFAAGRMKAVYWTEEDIARATVRRYRPGTAN